MIHIKRTSYRYSDISYGGENNGNWENFAQGLLQGDSSGPAIWIVSSSVIFELLHKRVFVAPFSSVIS